MRRALAEGTYRHYVGPPHIAPGARSKFAMILGDDRLPLIFARSRRSRSRAGRVTAVYPSRRRRSSPSGISRGRVIHQYADYDLRSDKELARTRRGRWEGAGSRAPLRPRPRARKGDTAGLPVATLTPQMRARLDPNGGWPGRSSP
ncbi:MAG: hypothetical protein U0232_31720 [Thermomicrobiales bacterium]